MSFGTRIGQTPGQEWIEVTYTYENVPYDTLLAYYVMRNSKIEAIPRGGCLALSMFFQLNRPVQEYDYHIAEARLGIELERVSKIINASTVMWTHSFEFAPFDELLRRLKC